MPADGHDPLQRVPAPILVVGGYGYRNVGDEAILAGLIRRVGPGAITVVSRNPRETRRLHGVRSIGFGEATVALLRHRSLLVGGGGVLGPDMGRLGRLLPVFGELATQLRRTVVVEGVDLEEHHDVLGRALTPRLLRRAWRVAVRDETSAEVARSWGVSSELIPDLSAWMPAADPETGASLLRRSGVDPEQPVVGLALTGMRADLSERVLTAVAAAMSALPAVQFAFVPMSRHPRVAEHDDTRLAERLVSMQSRLTILRTDVHPEAVLSAFGGFSAVVAMRYHAMLFAARAGVPLVAVPYAEKNARWLRERGLEAVTLSRPHLLSALSAALESASAAQNRMQPALS
jgi:polysaccharide pyruvyl transferase WcaK-like protein